MGTRKRKRATIAAAVLVLLFFPIGQAACLSHHHCDAGIPFGHHDDGHGRECGDPGPDAGRHDGQAFGETRADGHGHAAIDHTMTPRRVTAAAAHAPADTVARARPEGIRAGASLPADDRVSSPAVQYGFLFAGRSPTSA